MSSGVLLFSNDRGDTMRRIWGLISGRGGEPRGRQVLRLCRFMAVPAFVLATYASPAFAEPPGCREYRQSIIDLRTAPLQARKWRLFDLHLEVHYRKYCSRAYRLQPQQVWHKTDGTATGVSAAKPDRPPDGAYTTTDEHGKICATADSPSVCVP
jgi:hypothetical protein